MLIITFAFEYFHRLANSLSAAIALKAFDSPAQRVGFKGRGG
jgi:hypothetical protein